MLNSFLSKHNSKENFRNTWNDILILSKSSTKELPLVTEDKLLNRFAAELYDVAVSKHDKFLNIDFSKPHKESSKINNESKGYVNNGWRYKISKNYAP
ncbi:hypothetical protein DXT99_18450 [Pontibacter diazotrophicus]|uniref:Uncharacterized protein n=1 Tax=Pontibacter diazotrophicus TaxID=1400979 RepID=A0A3D8L8K6_9BACT|nr:hypothetical protein DXT99_18450 [Pontibacter diazotrophicus]